MLVRVIRCLDGMLYALVIFAVILLLPGAWPELPSPPGLWFVLPIMALAWFCFRLPATVPDDPQWPPSLLRLRLHALLLLGLAPFWGWALAAPRSWYLFANLMVGVLAGIGVLFYLNEVVRQLAAVAQREDLALEGKLNRYLLLYLLGVPMTSVLLVAVVAALMYHAPPVQVLCGLLPFPGREPEVVALPPRLSVVLLLVLVLPMVLCVSLLLRTRLALARLLPTTDLVTR